MEPERFAMYERIANVLVHMMGINVGFSLFADRKNLNALILENKSSTPFVTADQPVINISAKPGGSEIPTRFDLYYPISPNRAFVLLEPGGEAGIENENLSEALVQMLNLRIAAHAYRQVFSNSESVLENVRRELPAYMSCFQG